MTAASVSSNTVAARTREITALSAHVYGDKLVAGGPSVAKSFSPNQITTASRLAS